jgi:hypothetical protein
MPGTRACARARVGACAQRAAARSSTDRARISQLLTAVRDEIRYDPYGLSYDPQDYVASNVPQLHDESGPALRACSDLSETASTLTMARIRPGIGASDRVRGDTDYSSTPTPVTTALLLLWADSRSLPRSIKSGREFCLSWMRQCWRAERTCVSTWLVAARCKRAISATAGLVGRRGRPHRRRARPRSRFAGESNDPRGAPAGSYTDSGTDATSGRLMLWVWGWGPA